MAMTTAQLRERTQRAIEHAEKINSNGTIRRHLGIMTGDILMKTSRFTEQQVLAILRQAEGGVPVSELCREHGKSIATIYKWRAKYGSMDASMISQMKAFED